ncbi:MAG: rhodanese-like domain-containing protein [Bacteroidota bacterium]|nr:rhodanese-like domain-containing protein [Bacteroidota bacterium]
MKIQLIGLMMMVTLWVSAQTKQVAKEVEAKEFIALMKAKPGLVLDVRTKNEVAKGAIPNSVNYDIFEDNFEAEINKLDKSKPVYVYCASGGRSGEAMEMMKKNGFLEVYNLDGGYGTWKKESSK